MNMDAALSYVTYKMDPDGTLNYDDKMGSRYAAKLDGKDYPISGDDAIKFVSVRKIDNNTFEESYKDGAGKVRLVSTTKVAADGRHASMTNENKETGNVYHFEAEKE